MHWGFGTWRGLGALTLAVAASCQPTTPSQPPRAPRPELSEVFWNQDVSLPSHERIEAEVSLFGVRAGAFSMELTRSVDDNAADELLLRSEMSTVGVVRLFKATDGSSFTTMGTQKARPTRSELTVSDGSVERIYRATLAPGSALTTIERTGARTKRLREETPHGEHPLDMPSAFMLLRHWQARPGTRGYFYVLLGRHLWRVDARFRGEVPLPGREKDSERSALEIEGSAERVKLGPSEKREARHFAMWLSSDRARVPLRVEGDASFGTVDFVLTGHETSTDPPEASGIRAHSPAKPPPHARAD